MKCLSVFFAFLCGSLLAAAQLPVVGSDSLLEIATWNTLWFGDRDNGPSNETTQYNNIQAIIRQSGIDIWGLQEVSDAQTWNTLAANVSSKYMGYIATYNQVQKTAVLYDKNKFQLIPSQTGHVLTASEYSYDLAGRPPLCVALKTKNRPVTDTLYVLVIHMKAYADKDAYDRRTGASKIIRNYLDQHMAGKRWVICGDWNDDLYTSMYSGQPSPYLNLADTSAYVFISRELTDAGKRSYAKGNPGRMIDHILISARMKDWYLKGSARVLDELPQAVSGYVSNTSDHYPVLGLFDDRIKLPDTPVTGLINPGLSAIDVTCYPNPASGQVLVQAGEPVEHAVLYTLSGQLAAELRPGKDVFMFPFPDAAKGLYVLTVRTATGVGHVKVIVDR